MAAFYVYVHRRADTGAVFYVGKGIKRRAWVRQQRNPYWRNVVAKHGCAVEIVLRGVDEELAHLAEMELIDKQRRLGVPLTNLTDGGEGMSGHIQTEATRSLKSDALRGVAKSEEHRRKLSIARTGLKISDEGRAKLSAKRKGRPSPMLGKKHSTESKLKTSLALRGERNPFFGKKPTPEVVALIRAANLGRKATASERASKSAAHKGKPKPWLRVPYTADRLERKKALIASSRVTCMHCGLICDVSNAKRWHFDNCRERK